MAVLTWDGTGTRYFETGVDKGVLYVMDVAGAYPLGVPWNGLISVNVKPSGADVSALYADNINYLNLVAAEKIGASIEAYTFPQEFGVCDGSVAAHAGVSLGQQGRSKFGLVFRTKVGNDVDQDLGYKLHLLYGCLAAPSERAFSTINESPEAVTMSWEVTTTPAGATGFNPTAYICVDSRTADPTDLATLEDQLFGTVAIVANLPAPDAVLALFA